MAALAQTLVAAVALTGVLTGATPASGAWRWPLPAPHTVVRGFVPPPQPWLAGHRGVDLAGHPGEVVRSAGPGTVRFAGRVAGIGVVSVEHPDGLLTTYEPVAALVRRGQVVAAGQPLGRLQLAGSHCAPRACLHWGLRRGADYLDPLALVGPSRVRLLPLTRDAHGRSWLAPATQGASAVSSFAAVGYVGVARRRRRRRKEPAPVASMQPPVSRAGRRACRAAGAPPWCASGRCGSR